jgi:hypothetical protein
MGRVQKPAVKEGKNQVFLSCRERPSRGARRQGVKSGTPLSSQECKASC